MTLRRNGRSETCGFANEELTLIALDTYIRS